jgi:hypothetical protein
MRKLVVILIVGALLLGGVFYGLYEFNRKPASLTTKSIDISINASDLLLAFQENEEKANADYLDKVIGVSGTVGDIVNEGGVSSIYLETEDPMSSVICEMEQSPVTGVSVGDEIILKGQCTGYLMDIVLIKSVISNE